MFLHAGQSKNIRKRDIIGIFDTDNATLSSPDTRRFLAAAQKRGEVESPSKEIPKAFILYSVHSVGNNRRRIKLRFGSAAKVAAASGSGTKAAVDTGTGDNSCRVCLSQLSSASLLGRMTLGRSV